MIYKNIFSKVTCLTLLLVTHLSYGQYDKEYTVVDDINLDGKRDSVIIRESSETSGSYYELEFKFYGNKNTYTVTAEYDFSRFLCAIPLPDEVDLRNVSFIQKLSEKIWGLPYTTVGRAEFNWYDSIIEGEESISANAPIDFKSSFRVAWHKMKPDVKKGFATTVTSNSAILNITPFDDERKYKKYLIGYFATNHRNLSCSQITANPKDISLYTTNHGVLLKKKEEYAWIFINDITVFKFGSDKLRWPSIKSAKVFKNLVVVNTHSFSQNADALYVIDINLGKIIRINNVYWKILQIDDYTIENNEIKINALSSIKKIPLLEILSQ